MGWYTSYTNPPLYLCVLLRFYDSFWSFLTRDSCCFWRCSRCSCNGIFCFSFFVLCKLDRIIFVHLFTYFYRNIKRRCFFINHATGIFFDQNIKIHRFSDFYCSRFSFKSQLFCKLIDFCTYKFLRFLYFSL